MASVVTDAVVSAEYPGAKTYVVYYRRGANKKWFPVKGKVFYTWKDAHDFAEDFAGRSKGDNMKMVPLLNPIKPRKRAARKTKTIQRAGLAREAYVKRPSQMTGTKPTKRLVARRAVAKRKGTFPNPGGMYYVQLVRAPHDASGNPRKLAIVYDADGVRVDGIPYSYGTYDDDFKRLGYSHHIAMQYQIEITPKEFNWLKGAKRATNPKKSGVVTFPNPDGEMLPVRVGSGRETLDKLMTRKQAQAFADRTIPADLKRAGFIASVFRSDPEINGDDFFRINFSKGINVTRRATNPKKSAVVTFHAFNVITKENGKIQVHDGAQTQDAAARKAEQLAAANGQRHVYVASRAWIKSHTGA